MTDTDNRQAEQAAGAIEAQAGKEGDDVRAEAIKKAMENATPAAKALNKAIDETAERLRKVAAEWSAAYKEFLQSTEWAQVREIFPDATDEDAGALLMGDLINPIIENADDLQERIEQYEKENGCTLTFEDLMNPGDENDVVADLTLLERFMLELHILPIIDEWDMEPPRRGDVVLKATGAGIPKYFVSPNTYLSNVLQALDGKDTINAGPLDLPTYGKDTKKEVTTFVNIMVKAPDNMKLSGEYSEYDRVVHDAICSLYYADAQCGEVNRAYTADKIFRTMTHKTESEKVTDQQRAEVTESIEKHRHLWAEIDATDEMRARGAKTPDGTPITRFCLDDYLLSATKVLIEAGGQVKEGYRFKEPLLLTYANAANQKTTIRGDLLDIKEVKEKDGKLSITTKSLSNSKHRIAASSYLRRRIKAMENDEKQAAENYRRYKRKREKEPNPVGSERQLKDFRNISRVILFESLFTASGVTATNSKTRIKEYVFDVLKFWKARGFIIDYEAREGKGRGRGRTKDAIIITVKR